MKTSIQPNWTKQVKRLTLYLGYGNNGIRRSNLILDASKSKGMTPASYVLDLISKDLPDFIRQRENNT